jgi:hypothetical protein
MTRALRQKTNANCSFLFTGQARLQVTAAVFFWILKVKFAGPTIDNQNYLVKLLSTVSCIRIISAATAAAITINHGRNTNQSPVFSQSVEKENQCLCRFTGPVNRGLESNYMALP